MKVDVIPFVVVSNRFETTMSSELAFAGIIFVMGSFIMGTQEVHDYQRTFLSPNYVENFKFDDDDYWQKKIRELRADKRKSDELVARRERDIEAWENVRRSIAPLFKVQYHGGYWIAGAQGDQGGSSERRWVDGTPSDAVVAECIEPLVPWQGLITSPVTGQIALPNPVRWRNGLVENGKYREEIVLYDKLDQDFESYASPWELIWSNLSAPYNRGFVPVVNKSYTLAGHWGTVMGGTSPAGGNMPVFAAPADYSGSLKDALENGIPIFVSSVGGIPDGWKVPIWYTPEHTIEVKTGTDGEVMNFQVTNSGFVEQPWYSPMDLYYIGKALVSLVKVGAKLTVTLLSKKTSQLEARVLLSGPTRALAKESLKKEVTLAGKTSTGMAVTRAGVLPAEHMASRTFILGEDMAEIKKLISSARTESGMYDVIIHGDSTTFSVLIKSGGKEVWRDVSVQEVADLIRPHLAPGDQIRLLACDVGTTGGPAQALATELNRTVWASTTKVPAAAKITRAGRSVFVPVGGGTFSNFLP